MLILKLVSMVGLFKREEAKISVFDSGYLVGDGIWAKYWYSNIHISKGFIEYQTKTEPFPEHLLPLLEASKPFYQQLVKESI